MSRTEDVKSVSSEIVWSSLVLKQSVDAMREDMAEMRSHMSAFGESLGENGEVCSVVDSMHHTLCRIEQQQAKQLEDIKTELDDNKEALAGLINASSMKAEKMKQELSEEIAALSTKITTLLSGKYKYPTMMVIVPDTEKASGMARLDLRRLLKDRYRLYFMCSHTLEVVASGPDGRGYAFTRTKAWVKRAAPVLLACLLAVQIGMTVAAGGVPIPIPGLSQLLADVTQTQPFIDEAVRLVKEASEYQPAVEEAASLIQGGVAEDAATMDPSVSPDDHSREATREAYLAIQQLMGELDPALQYTGLRFVTDDSSGISAWVKDDQVTEDSFRLHRGQRKPAAASVQPSSASSASSAAASAAPPSLLCEEVGVQVFREQEEEQRMTGR